MRGGDETTTTHTHHEELHHVFNSDGVLLQAESFEHLKFLSRATPEQLRKDWDMVVREFGTEGTAKTTLDQLEMEADFEADARPSNEAQLHTVTSLEELMDYIRSVDVPSHHQAPDIDLDEQLVCMAQVSVLGPKGHGNNSVHGCFRGMLKVVERPNCASPAFAC
jgi:hypothetical protein